MVNYYDTKNVFNKIQYSTNIVKTKHKKKTKQLFRSTDFIMTKVIRVNANTKNVYAVKISFKRWVAADGKSIRVLIN